ncbi:MAG: hypothetical protein ACTHJ0_04845, partial [Flavipsychrobacter sp.]
MFLVLLVSTFSSYLATASTRYTSAEMFADYIGTGPGDYRYRVTLVIYAACTNSAPTFNSTERVCWESTCYTTQKSKNLPLITGSPDTLDNMYCPSATNSCHDATSTNLGFGRAIYSDTLTLASYPCTDWTFDWEGGPRDNAANLFSTSYNVDVRCVVNNTGSYFNTSTPRYLSIPKFVLCYNQHNEIAVSPYDPNGDSLFTQNVLPHTGTGCFSGYTKTYPATGYSVSYPIDATASDPFTVNPYTGYSTVTPVSNGYKYAVTYETDKFDPLNGTNLGFCQRDMEFFVQTCSATPAPYTDSFITSLTGGSYDSASQVISVCPNVKFSINMNAYGGVPNSSKLSFTSDNATTAPGSNFYPTYITTGKADSMIATFDWTPSAKNIGLHVVTFHLKDSACASDQLGTYDFSIVISVGYSPYAGPDQSYCPGKSNSLPVQLSVVGVPPGANFYWYDASTGVGANDSLSDSTAQSPLADPSVTTDYVVVVTDASGNPLACKANDTVRVKVFPAETVNAGPD